MKDSLESIDNILEGVNNLDALKVTWNQKEVNEEYR
jgi:hypothetical protein